MKGKRLIQMMCDTSLEFRKYRLQKQAKKPPLFLSVFKAIKVKYHKEGNVVLENTIQEYLRNYRDY